jgi:hypothetical protein
MGNPADELPRSVVIQAAVKIQPAWAPGRKRLGFKHISFLLRAAGAAMALSSSTARGPHPYLPIAAAISCAAFRYPGFARTSLTASLICSGPESWESVQPAPRAATISAFSIWSLPAGRHTIGTPNEMAAQAERGGYVAASIPADNKDSHQSLLGMLSG